MLRATSLFVFATLLTLPAAAQDLPVQEVTVFKDGHAVVLREGSVAVAANGTAVLDTLPQPVLGTFWPYATTPGVTLQSVTAGRRQASHTRPALTIPELLEANIGKRAWLTIASPSPTRIEATLLSLPKPQPLPEGNPFAATDPRQPNFNPGFGGFAPTTSTSPSLVLLQTTEGTRALPLPQITELTFPEAPTRTLTEERQENRLTLQLKGATGSSTKLGVLYVQRGLRWIPSYQLTLGKDGKARLKLQATLINELTDLENATVNLVIGVPKFMFQGVPDPIALSDTLARLSPYFGGDARTGNAFSNAMMSQSAGGGFGYAARSGEASDGNGGTPAGGSELSGGGKTEDLYIFTLKNVTLKRYERAVVPITEVTLSYKDIYTLELLPTPSRNRYGGYDSEPNPELKKLLGRARVQHKVRLTNSSGAPITTAPTLILSDGRVIGQGMTTYAGKGATCDVTIGEAPDIRVKRTDEEKQRTPNALIINGSHFTQVSMTGRIELCNFQDKPVELEVTRYVLGKLTSTSEKGELAALDMLDDDEIPAWWSVYGMRSAAFTNLGRAFWKVTLPPGGTTCINLDYLWHYFVG